MIADLVRNTFVYTLMLFVGFLMGWRFEQGVPKMLFGVMIALLFGYAFSWVMATIGLAVKTPEAAQSASFLPIFPLVFVSSIFVPVASMPDWLQGFAENQPVSVVANTVRSLMIPEEALVFLGIDQGTLILKSFAWIVAITAVFAPLAVRQYKKSLGEPLVVDPSPCHHPTVEGMFHFLHFGDGVSHINQRLRRIPAGDEHVDLLGPLSQR